MPPAAYSFIDVVALDDVRERFANGDAIVILSIDLIEVIWANGPGAALFGTESIEAIIGEGSGLGFAARRQIMSTRGFPHIGRDRSVTVRLNQGNESRAIGFRASAISMPDGEYAIMLSVPAGAGGSRAAAISGFTQPGHLAALVDGRGQILTATGGFETLGLSTQSLNDLVRDVTRSSDGLIKRKIPRANGNLPAGIALLRDQPALCLLMVVDEDEQHHVAPFSPSVAQSDAIAPEIGAPSSNVEFVPTATLAAPRSSSETVAAPLDDIASIAATNEAPADAIATEIRDMSDDFDRATVMSVDTSPAPLDGRDEAHPAPDEAIAAAPDVNAASVEDMRSDIDFAQVTGSEESHLSQAERNDQAIEADAQTTVFNMAPDAQDGSASDGVIGIDPSFAAAAASEPNAATNADMQAAMPNDSISDDPELSDIIVLPEEGTPSNIDMEGNGQEQARLDTEVIAPTVVSERAAQDSLDTPADRSTTAVRFTWRTDGEGRFTAISSEFVDTVGDAAGDVIGRTFRDVSESLKLDPTGDIIGLLDRRDTWSGRQVFWPIAGTDLKIPVDLAALPVYSRDRRFEGFRGFGVARNADVVMDPEAIGLQLESDSTIEAFTAASVGLIEANDADLEPSPAVSDPFKGEVPALSFAPQPERRLSDKIIKLAEHRPTAPERGLTPVEKVAFREIGERLKKAELADSGSLPAHETAKADNENAADRPVPSAPNHVGDKPVAANSTITPPPAVDHVAQTETIAEPDLAPEATDKPDTPDVAKQADFFGGSEAVPAIEAAGPEEPGQDIGSSERDDATADLFEQPTGLDESQSREDNGDDPARAADEEYEPSTFEGWSELTPPVEEALEEIDDARPAEHEAEVEGELVPYPAPEPVQVDGAATDIAPPEAETALRPSAQDVAPDDDQTAIAADEYEPSTFEGWSELTPPVEEALEEIDDARPAEHEAEVEGELVPYPAPEPVQVDGAATDIAPPEAETALRPSAQDAASDADQTTIAADEYEPSTFEGWSELTPPAEEALETADLAEGEASERVATGRAIQDTTILSRLPVPILIHSGDLLHYANDEFLDLTGYESVETLADAGGLDALFAEAYQDGPTDADRSLRLKTSDGTEFPIEAVLRAVPWQSSRALMLVVRRTGGTEPPLTPPVLEVSERDELKARLAEMRTIIDTATDGVILIDDQGAIRSISRPAEALFGFDSDDLSGKPFVSLFAIESQRAARDYLAGLSGEGVANVLNDGREVIGREAEGRFIPLFMSVGKLPNDSGFCAVVRDLTQWKRAEEELTHARALAERASSQKTDFLARISHEIRTPLNAIIGFSELMMDERFGSIGNERYRDYLRDINRSGSHVLDLVNDLLDISKIEAGEQEMAHEAVSLNETISQSVAMMQPQANRERVIIRSSLASRLPDVVADLRSVRQIALNLLSNAIRYTQAGGQVIVSTSYEPSGEVVMRIRDTGIGMTQAEIEQALKPFKQINALKRTRGDGTGLGLPLTKAMVEANRARFAINSTPGDGTLVEVSFPATRVLAR